jgi:hypothetical protein
MVDAEIFSVYKLLLTQKSLTKTVAVDKEIILET